MRWRWVRANTCHEMHDNVYQEYMSTIHYQNRTGVRAICSDCHVPKDWGHKVLRKIKASGELWGHFTGKIDTREKFEKHRMVLAQNEWRTMKATDSRECRNCHSFTAMEVKKQRPKAQQMHALAQQQGKTCIDCHKGIAHLLPDEYDESVDYTAGIVTVPATNGNDARERRASKSPQVPGSAPASTSTQAPPAQATAAGASGEATPR